MSKMLKMIALEVPLMDEARIKKEGYSICFHGGDSAFGILGNF